MNELPLASQELQKAKESKSFVKTGTITELESVIDEEKRRQALLEKQFARLQEVKYKDEERLREHRMRMEERDVLREERRQQLAVRGPRGARRGSARD